MTLNLNILEVAWSTLFWDSIIYSKIKKAKRVITYSTRVIILKFDSIKIGEIYIHSSAITKYHEIVKISFSIKCRLQGWKLNKSFPHLYFFKDKDLKRWFKHWSRTLFYSQDFSMLWEDGFEKIMSN